MANIQLSTNTAGTFKLNYTATDESGIIKSIEHREYKIFGQMWHSEREMPFDKYEVALIEDFFND